MDNGLASRVNGKVNGFGNFKALSEKGKNILGSSSGTWLVSPSLYTLRELMEIFDLGWCSYLRSRTQEYLDEIEVKRQRAAAWHACSSS
jgi:hypothetical protein